MPPRREPLPTTLALGAWLKNSACLLDGGVPAFSAQHGDLGDPAARASLEASASALLSRAGGRVAAIAHDLHPDFFSTQLAVALAQELGVPAVGVQHHRAHIAAVMAEHGVDEPVVGLALDGMGLGDDGQAWGGELLAVDDNGFRRLAHLWPLALPGGDRAAREPWRMAASALHALGRGSEIADRFGPLVGDSAARGVQTMLERGIHSPPTTSAGRWFDAAAGALGLSIRQADEAEAAIALQCAAQQWLGNDGGQGEAAGRPEVQRRRATPVAQLDLRPLLARLLDSPQEAFAVRQAAAAFHEQLGDALADWAADAATQRATRIVCLGGGCFFNPLLTARVTQRLQRCGLRVLRPVAHSCGDAGLALGQAWVAAHQLAGASRRHVRSIAESLPCA